MRLLLLFAFLGLASCKPSGPGGPGGGPGGLGHPGPPAKHAYAEKWIKGYIEKKLNVGGIKTSFLSWGPNWEATPGQIRAQESKGGGKAFFPTAFFVDGEHHRPTLPAVAFAQEMMVRRIDSKNPSRPLDETLLFLFDAKGEFLTFIGLDGQAAARGPGRWVSSLPAG